MVYFCYQFCVQFVFFVLEITLFQLCKLWPSTLKFSLYRKVSLKLTFLELSSRNHKVDTKLFINVENNFVYMLIMAFLLQLYCFYANGRNSVVAGR